MTDIRPPPDDPAERLRWAKGLLRDFSSPAGRNAVCAAELRAMAREIISELDPSVQSKPKRTHRKRADAVDVRVAEHPVEPTRDSWGPSMPMPESQQERRTGADGSLQSDLTPNRASHDRHKAGA